MKKRKAVSMGLSMGAPPCKMLRMKDPSHQRRGSSGSFSEATVEEICNACKCNSSIARAALMRGFNAGMTKAACVSTAKRLLTDSLQAVYAKDAEVTVAARASEPKTAAELLATAGDDIFQHEYTQCLLDVARAQVREAFAQQTDEPAGRWLICVRTYGRARPEARGSEDELVNWIEKHSSKKGNEVERFASSLRKNGVDSVPKLVKALQTPGKLFKRIRAAGGCRFSLKTLEKMRECAKSVGNNSEKFRNGGILQLTLRALERALGSDAYSRTLLFVSHEDKDFMSGRYTQALKGTPWVDRLVVGLKGAHTQARFIEEAAPLGEHIIIADDNIECFVAEVPTEKLKACGKQGAGYWTRSLDVRETYCALDGTGHRVAPKGESELRRFVRATFPNCDIVKQARRFENMENLLRKSRIDSPAKLMSAMERLKLGKQKAQVAKQPKTIELDKAVVMKVFGKGVGPAYKALKSQESRQLPPQRLLVHKSPAKPNLQMEGTGLKQLFSRAWFEMCNQGANLWSVNTSKNHFFMHGSGESLRRNAVRYGVFQDFHGKLGLVYGAFFGFKVLKDPRRYTRFGQVKDDVERSLRYWHCDGINIRFDRYAVIKRQKPGKFKQTKGGISMGTDEAGHKAEGQRALRAMLVSFAWRYARLPRATEDKYSDCGLIWIPRLKRHDADDDDAPELIDEQAPPRAPACRKPLARASKVDES